MKMYEMTGDQVHQLRAQSKETPVEIDIAEDDFPPAEAGAKDHQQYTVHWLGQDTKFQGTLQTGGTDAVVSLELATDGPPRTAKLMVNGEFAKETYRVEGNFWSTAPTLTRFHVTLKDGMNLFRLASVEPAGSLPDGREAAFLMIGDVKVVRASQNQ